MLTEGLSKHGRLAYEKSLTNIPLYYTGNEMRDIGVLRNTFEVSMMDAKRMIAQFKANYNIVGRDAVDKGTTEVDPKRFSILAKWKNHAGWFTTALCTVEDATALLKQALNGYSQLTNLNLVNDLTVDNPNIMIVTKEMINRSGEPLSLEVCNHYRIERCA